MNNRLRLDYNRGQNVLRKLRILRIYFNHPKGKHRLEWSKPSLPLPPPHHSMLIGTPDNDPAFFF